MNDSIIGMREGLGVRNVTRGRRVRRYPAVKLTLQRNKQTTQHSTAKTRPHLRPKKNRSAGVYRIPS